MTSVHIQEARPEDHPQIRELAPELTTGMPQWRSADAQRAAAAAWVAGSLKAAASGAAIVYVASPDGGSPRVLGFASVAERGHFTGERQGYLGELVVAPEHRRAGVAVALVAAAEDWVRRRGLATMSLETGAANHSARALYSRLGYVEEEVTLAKGL